jgi:iron complex outermembrane receptor protein
LLGLAGAPAAPAADLGFEDFDDADLGAFLDDIVTSVSRQSRTVSDAPAAVTVITREEILATGARSIPEALRMVPGVDVLYITAADHQVSVRGFVGPMADKTLVLLDGRPVYFEYNGLTPWDALQLVPEDVERVEVVRGPGSVIHGPNAFSGVINVVTRSPAELSGTTVHHLGGGLPVSAGGSVVHARPIAGGHAKVSLGWDRDDGWADSNALVAEATRFSTAWESRRDDGSRLYAGAGFTNGNGFTMSHIGDQARDQRVGFVRAGYRLSRVGLEGYWNSTDVDTRNLATGDAGYFRVSSYDLEAFATVWEGERAEWLVGTNVRTFHGESDFTAARFEEWLVSGFAEGTLRPSSSLTATLGGRVDRYPLTGTKVSPRVGLRWEPAEHHALRLSHSTAYRDPDFLESFLDEITDVSAQVSPLLPAGSIQVHSLGNRTLERERIRSFEAGYQGVIGPAVRVQLDAFHQRMNDFIEFGVTGVQDVSALLGLPAGSVVVPAEQSYSNIGEGRSWGGEAALEWAPREGTELFANASYQRLERTAAGAPAGTPLVALLETPRRKFNAGVRTPWAERGTISLWVHGVDETRWDRNIATGRVPGHVTVNGRVGVGFSRARASLSLSVYNLFDQEHVEIAPLDAAGLPNGAETLGRRWLATLRFDG